MEVVPQNKGVKLAQPPDNSCIAGLVKPAPMPLSVIVGLVVWATNLYHISYITVPAQSGATIVGAELVAAYTSSVVFTHVVAEVSVIAPEQALLAGAASVTHISKPQPEPVAAVFAFL